MPFFRPPARSTEPDPAVRYRTSRASGERSAGIWYHQPGPHAAREASVIHPTAEVSPEARIGPDTRIWHYCHVREGATIGAECVLGRNVYVEDGAVVGNRVKIQNNVSVDRASRVVIACR